MLAPVDLALPGPVPVDPVLPGLASADPALPGVLHTDSALPGSGPADPALAPGDLVPADAVLPGLAPAGLLDRLDPEQRAAAAVVSGPLLVVAGPGTGKTRTLTHRIAHLVADHGVPAEQCLAITFTRRAAAELAERLAVLVPGQAPAIVVTTMAGADRKSTRLNSSH